MEFGGMRLFKRVFRGDDVVKDLIGYGWLLKGIFDDDEVLEYAVGEFGQKIEIF